MLPDHTNHRETPESGVCLPCIAGATGTGKTAAALALAQAFERPVIINADSRQVYADFPLITAQPSPEELAACEHRLYGFLPCAKKLGAGEYARLARRAVEDAFATGGQPILVGGTGLYFKALLEGIAPIPDIPAKVGEYWQKELEARGSHALHGLLGVQDPEYAAKIHPNDRQRITRALEVMEATGKPFSWWHAQPLSPFPARIVKTGLALPMEELEPILNRRIEAMLLAGAEDEARAALERCPDAGAPGWSGIGCRELLDFLNKTRSLEECLDLWRRNTRAYAKRQNTWFRADKGIVWFRPEQTGALVRHVLKEMA